MRRRRFFAWALALALAAAALELAGAAIRARLADSVGGASWIWTSGGLDSHEPVAFYAVADFEIEVAGPARLAITADETYAAYLNGRRVGSGAYRAGAPADLYDVGADLEAGWNRLAVELASSRGAGGLLASLRSAGRQVLVTGGGWGVLRRYAGGILRGWTLAGGEPARVWQLHPTGRWSVAAAAERAALPIDLPERRALRFRGFWDGSPWRELDAVKKRFSEQGSRLYFDWGEEVTGFLTLELADDGGGAGLLYVGTELPAEDPPADALIVPVPGRGVWIDVHPRTFRYAYLVGVPLREAPTVQLLAPEIASRLAPPAPRRGVFGLEPPRPDTPAEENVRRRLSKPKILE